LTDRLILHFAVGTFDNWQQLSTAFEDLRLREFVFHSFNCLALKQVFSGRMVVISSLKSVAVQSLTFSSGPEEICCTSGPLATCLHASVEAGATNLKDAFGLWLVPRHARYLERAVEERKILLWLDVADTDEERSACQSLLKTSSGLVGVHDIILGSRSFMTN
jgi:hypothetical protein